MILKKLMMQKLLLLLTAGTILAGCNVGATPAPTQDIDAINTSIVGTTMAQLSSQFTQTALAVPSPTSRPTNTAATLPTAGGASPTAGALPTISFNSTPLPGFTVVASPLPAGATASLGDACSNSVFEGDVTVPDGTIFRPGEDFQKVWAIRNTGTCIWDDGYALIFIAGDRAIDPYDFVFRRSDDFVSSGEGINIGIRLTAPLAVGTYEGHWRMRNDQGFYFGTILSVYIEVKNP